MNHSRPPAEESLALPVWPIPNPFPLAISRQTSISHVRLFPLGKSDMEFGLRKKS